MRSTRIVSKRETQSFLDSHCALKCMPNCVVLQIERIACITFPPRLSWPVTMQQTLSPLVPSAAAHNSSRLCWYWCCMFSLRERHCSMRQRGVGRSNKNGSPRQACSYPTTERRMMRAEGAWNAVAVAARASSSAVFCIFCLSRRVVIKTRLDISSNQFPRIRTNFSMLSCRLFLW